MNNFTGVYLYYIPIILIITIGMSFIFRQNLPQLRADLKTKDDSQAKNFRELIFFIGKFLLFRFLGIVIFFGIGYLGLFIWLKYYY